MSEQYAIVEIPCDSLIDNDLSANAEDTVTFRRLQREMLKHGMLEVPVVVAVGDGKYRIIAGHHRSRAWRANGNATCPCRVIASGGTPEEEFNLVNNMNLVRGSVRKGKVLEIVRDKQLDPLKLDIFKFPATGFLATVSEDAIKQKSGEAARRAKLAQLTTKIAQEIAATIVGGKDDLTTVFVVEDKMAAVLRVPFSSATKCRENVDKVKTMIVQGLARLLPSGLVELAPEAEKENAEHTEIHPLKKGPVLATVGEGEHPVGGGGSVRGVALDGATAPAAVEEIRPAG